MQSSSDSPVATPADSPASKQPRYRLIKTFPEGETSQKVFDTLEGRRNLLTAAEAAAENVVLVDAVTGVVAQVRGTLTDAMLRQAGLDTMEHVTMGTSASKIFTLLRQLSTEAAVMEDVKSADELQEQDLVRMAHNLSHWSTACGDDVRMAIENAVHEHGTGAATAALSPFIANNGLGLVTEQQATIESVTAPRSVAAPVDKDAFRSNYTGVQAALRRLPEALMASPDIIAALNAQDEAAAMH